jgi:hypothetical protein
VTTQEIVDYVQTGAIVYLLMMLWFGKKPKAKP